MSIRDRYNWENPAYAPLHGPARDVVSAYQNAARWLDTIQEWVYIEAGLIHTARIIHNLAHAMPVQFDRFGDMLHERHLAVEYPGTPELVEEIGDMDHAFFLITGILEAIDKALQTFCEIAEESGQRAMVIQTEELIADNSKHYTYILNMWGMWERTGSETSFDSWAWRFGREEDEDDED